MLPHPAERPLNLQRFPNGAERARLLAEGHPGDGAGVAPALEGGRGRRARGERPPHRRSGRRAVLARQPGVVRDPRLDLAHRRPVTPDVRLIDIDPARRRPGTRRRHARPALPEPRSSTSACAATPRPPASAASRSGSRSSRSTRSARRATGSSGCRGPSGRPVPTSSRGSGPRPAGGGKARLDYTQNTYIKTLVAPYAVRPADGAPVSAPISGTSSTTPTCARPLDDPDDRRPGRRGRRPVRRRPDRPPGAARL